MAGPLTRPAPDPTRVALALAARLTIRVILFGAAVVTAYLILSALDRPAHADTGSSPVGQQVTDLVPDVVDQVAAPVLPKAPKADSHSAPSVPTGPVTKPLTKPLTKPEIVTRPAADTAGRLVTAGTRTLEVPVAVVGETLRAPVGQTLKSPVAVVQEALRAPVAVVQQTLPAPLGDQVSGLSTGLTNGLSDGLGAGLGAGLGGGQGPVAGLLPIPAVSAPVAHGTAPVTAQPSTTSAPRTVGTLSTPGGAQATTRPASTSGPDPALVGPVSAPNGRGVRATAGHGSASGSPPGPVTPLPRPGQAPDALTLSQLGGSGGHAAPVHATVTAGWSPGLACRGGVTPAHANGRGRFVRHGRLPG